MSPRSPQRGPRVLATVVAATAVTTSVVAQDPVVILRAPGRSYETASAALAARLQVLGHPYRALDFANDAADADRTSLARQLGDARPSVIAAAGARATSFALDSIPDIPVVFFTVPNALDRPFLDEQSPHRKRVTGVTTDVQPADMIGWIVRMHIEHPTIAVLFSDRTRRTLRSLQAAAEKESGVAIVPIEADRSAFPKAIEALNAARADSVLMLPDLRIFDRATIPRLLLWGLRQKRPVWAFNTSVVKAGAFAGQYVDHAHIGQQAAEVVHRVLGGETPADIGVVYPKAIHRAVNERTAEMIGVKLNPNTVGAETLRFGGRK